LIIDTHVHIWKRAMIPDSLMRSYLEPLLALDGIFDLSDDRINDWPMSQVKAEDLVEHMVISGIDRSVLLPLDFGLVEKTEAGVEEYNDWVFEMAQKFPSELIPFMGIDPQRKEALSLMEKYIKKFDAKGIKIYPATGFYPNEDRIRTFWDSVDDHGLVALTHAGAAWGPLEEKYNRPAMFSDVLDKHENMRLVIAHMGGKFREEMYQLVHDYPNAYTDISALQGWLPSNPDMVISRLKEAAERIPDRVLFGSDWPLFDLVFSHASWVRFVKEQPWGDESMKERLLGGNFQRLMRW
jgi:predicted TIM-barrel fold metal-dependent hydrolase